MFVVRPVCQADLESLLALAELTLFGLTTLPRDAELLSARIRESVTSFSQLETAQPRGQAYLLVLEEAETGRVIGTSGVVSKVGGFEPFYSYRIELSVQESMMLQIRKEIPVLHLVTEHNGPSEIGSLFLHPDFRSAGVGRLLSLSRFLMMAEFPHLFDREVIAEMRGVINDQGQSPFWDAVGKHFFDLEFPKADYLSIVNKEFIGDLMPVHPLYIPLLPPEAQAVIGEVHEKTRPARKLLEKEGFQFRQMIDIFEAGPILHCPRTDIRAVRESQSATVQEIVAAVDSGPDWLISNAVPTFRAIQSPLQQSTGASQRVVLSRQTADLLQVKPGDAIRYVAPRPGETS